jgi:hypothetical protein
LGKKRKAKEKGVEDMNQEEMKQRTKLFALGIIQLVK